MPNAIAAAKRNRHIDACIDASRCSRLNSIAHARRSELANDIVHSAALHLGGDAAEAGVPAVVIVEAHGAIGDSRGRAGVWMVFYSPKTETVPSVAFDT